MSKILKIYGVLVGLWLTTSFAVFVFPHSSGLVSYWILFDLFIGFLLTLIAAAFFLIALIKKRDFKSPLLAILLVVSTTWFLWANELWIGIRLHFYLYRNYYESTIKKITEATNLEERQRRCGEDCITLTNKPLRVSFKYALIPDWKDIVYDPTGEIALPKNSIYENRAIKTDTSYFINAEKITNSWYLGSFAD